MAREPHVGGIGISFDMGLPDPKWILGKGNRKIS